MEITPCNLLLVIVTLSFATIAYLMLVSIFDWNPIKTIKRIEQKFFSPIKYSIRILVPVLLVIFIFIHFKGKPVRFVNCHTKEPVKTMADCGCKTLLSHGKE